ncbi:hypothetical protein ACFWUZ_20090 [Streptomyces sp. NPDC058646]|uniref:hypothetical protein n=1 Tax=Streptomyces sp. NPDC058646 TaxID=3346574 RepID=UPI00365EC4F9
MTDASARIWRWLAEAAEHTRPSEGIARDYQGTSPVPLPPADPDTRLDLPG